jgi:parvulin-like peptidyl-prolyl isomerase
MSVPIPQVGETAIAIEQLPLLLRRYQLMSQMIRGIVLERAIASITCTQEELEDAIAFFEKQHQIASAEARETWLPNQGMNLEEIAEIAIRPLKIGKFKQLTWGHKVETYFLARKSSLDQVVYSLIRTKDKGFADEMYFRISEGEQSFTELAREYSQGAEAQTGGLLGPVPLTNPHPAISRLLAVSQVGQLWTPRLIGDWYVIVRLEKFIPARLDEAMRRFLLDELCEQWLQDRVKQMEPLQFTR